MPRAVRWVALWAMVSLTATPQFFARSGSISASANPCAPGPAQSSCTTTISWSSQGTLWVQVWVSLNDNPEKHFASSGAGGPHSRDASQIEKISDFTYTFSLYDYSWGIRGVQLASVKVTGTGDMAPSDSTNETPAADESFQTPGLSPNSPSTSTGFFLPCAAANAAELARLRLRVHLPPLPVYPADGDIPAELQNRYVFLDEHWGELILSFPPYDFEELQPGQERRENRVVDRVPLSISSCPSLSVAIYQPGDPQTRGHVYRYRLHNRRQAKQSIDQFLLPVRLNQEVMPVYGLVQPYWWGVSDWGGPKEGSIEGQLNRLSYSWGDDYRQEMQQSMLRRRINWYAKLSKYVLEPGDTLESFGFTTEAQPGIVRAYLEGAPSVTSFRSSWPQETRFQVSPFQLTENNSLSVSTIGPKFPPDADRRWMASDFLDSLGELIRNGELPGESTFIQEVLRHLETVADGDGGAVDPAFWPSEPETDFQAEILNAIRLSLGD